MQICQFESWTGWFVMSQSPGTWFPLCCRRLGNSHTTGSRRQDQPDWRDPARPHSQLVAAPQHPSAKLWDRGLMGKGDIWKLGILFAQIFVSLGRRWAQAGSAEGGVRAACACRQERQDNIKIPVGLTELLQLKLQPENEYIYSILACLPSLYVFLFINDSRNVPNVVTCEQCMIFILLNSSV